MFIRTEVTLDKYNNALTYSPKNHESECTKSIYDCATVIEYTKHMCIRKVALITLLRLCSCFCVPIGNIFSYANGADGRYRIFIH